MSRSDWSARIDQVWSGCSATSLQGPCPPTVAGPYAAWMPRKNLQGRTCGVSRDGGRARTRRNGRCAWLSTRQPADSLGRWCTALEQRGPGSSA
ncbi:hypothetical protein XaCFBP7622_12895 [Xanthomonas arboricola]|nr:hypothetical protein XaCFBP7622_12895 [Xanthomonas arboricola]